MDNLDPFLRKRNHRACKPKQKHKSNMTKYFIRPKIKHIFLLKTHQIETKIVYSYLNIKYMKSILFVILFVSTSVFAQDKVFLATVENSSEFNSLKEKGEFNFIVSKQMTKEMVEKNAAYYAKSFTVELDEKKHLLKIKMLENNENNRHIMNRFLITSKISQIDMEGKSYKVDEFYQKHTK
jgi:hypothetical protein